MNMWQDLRKLTTYAHNDKAKLLQPIDSLLNKLKNTFLPLLQVNRSTFTGAAFWGMSNMHQYSDGLEMAVVALNK